MAKFKGPRENFGFSKLYMILIIRERSCLAYSLFKGTHKQTRKFSMKTRNKLIFTTAGLALAIAVGTFVFKASSQERGPGMGMRFMHGMNHGMMGAGSNSASTAEIDIIHKLIINHDLIR